MSHRTKKALFTTLAILFFAAIPVIVLFTQGYRVDLENRRLVETGGLDFDITAPLNTKIYLNGELKKETSFIFRNAVFRNILPDTYEARIEKEGHQPWHKTTEVEAGRVTQFIDIRLFPTELTETTLTERVSAISISPTKQFALTLSQGAETTIGGRSKQLVLVNTENDTNTSLLTLQPGESVSKMRWASNGQTFYITIHDTTGATTGYTGAVSGEGGLLNWSTFLSQSYTVAYEEENVVQPGNATSILYVLKQQPDQTFSLDRVNLAQRTIRPDIVTEIIGWHIAGESIFYVTTSGALKKTNIENGTTEEISPTALAQPDTTGTEIIVREDEAALVVLSDNNAFLWEEGEPLSKIAGEVNDASFGPKNENILLQKDDGAVVYWTEGVFGPPRRTVGSIETIQMPGLKEVQWATPEGGHILLQTPRRVIIAELDGRDRRNIARYEIRVTEPFAIRRDPNNIFTVHKNNFVELSYKPR